MGPCLAGKTFLLSLPDVLMGFWGRDFCCFMFLCQGCFELGYFLCFFKLEINFPSPSYFYAIYMIFVF